MILHYKDASLDHLPIIVFIYNTTIASRMVTADTEPVTVESKQSWFYEHNCQSRPLWIVLNEHNEVVGWVSFQSFYGRPAYDATAEISIYLAEEHRGKGAGKQILQYCIQTAPALGIKTLLGFIFSHNIHSLTLFEKCGFEKWGNLPDIANLDGIERSLMILGIRIA